MLRLSEYFDVKPSIVALSLVSLVVMMGFSMVTPSLTLYAQHDLDANEFFVGAAVAGFAVGRLVFDMPAGFLADRLGLSKTMILGLCILAGSSTLAGLAPNYWTLLAARTIEGMGSAMYVSAAVAFVLVSSEASRRGTNMGSYQSMLMLGPIFGPVIGAPLAAYLGYNAPYFAFAGMMVAALVIVASLAYTGRLMIVRSTSDKGEAKSKASMSVYLNTAAVATFGFAFLRSGIYNTGMPLFAYGGLSISVFDVGIILAVASTANLISSFFSGRITRAYGMEKPLFAVILTSAILVAIIPLAPSMEVLLAIMTVIGVTSGFFGQSIAWAAEQIEERVKRSSETAGLMLSVNSHVTRGIGINRLIGDLGLVLGPLFVGYLISVFSSNQLIWFISFGSTSAVLAIISFSIIGTKVKPNIIGR